MLDSFRDKIDRYKELIEIMLLHYKNTYDVNSKNLNILYNSSYFISEFKTHIENNDTIPINFFDAHHKKILAQLFSNSPDKYIEKYQSLKKNDAYNNLENIIINISQQETKELLKIDINNFEQNKVFYSQKNIQISPVFKASIKKLKKSLAEKN
jgi:hypothetical protein